MKEDNNNTKAEETVETPASAPAAEPKAKRKFSIRLFPKKSTLHTCCGAVIGYPTQAIGATLREAGELIAHGGVRLKMVGKTTNEAGHNLRGSFAEKAAAARDLENKDAADRAVAKFKAKTERLGKRLEATVSNLEQAAAKAAMTVEERREAKAAEKAEKVETVKAEVAGIQSDILDKREAKKVAVDTEEIPDVVPGDPAPAGA